MNPQQANHHFVHVHSGEERIQQWRNHLAVASPVHGRYNPVLHQLSAASGSSKTDSEQQTCPYLSSTSPHTRLLLKLGVVCKSDCSFLKVWTDGEQDHFCIFLGSVAYLHVGMYVSLPLKLIWKMY